METQHRKRCSPIEPGQRSGRLVFLENIPRQSSDPRKSGYKPHVRCLCDCGTECVVSRWLFVHGQTLSCGCLRSERSREKNTTHGRTRTPEYQSWQSMLARTENPNNKEYRIYGAVGRTVCAEWHDFERFFQDMGPRPSLQHSLERVNNSLGYFPGNVIWGTPTEQSNNRTTNHRLDFDGREQTVTEWAKELGTTAETLYRRLNRGWSVERTLTTPIRVWRKHP
jgi:hypothetical protein